MLPHEVLADARHGDDGAEKMREEKDGNGRLLRSRLSAELAKQAVGRRRAMKELMAGARRRCRAAGGGELTACGTLNESVVNQGGALASMHSEYEETTGGPAASRRARSTLKLLGVGATTVRRPQGRRSRSFLGV
jgi:hypothetical protein